MSALHLERDDRALVASGAEDADGIHLAQSLLSIGPKRLLVRADRRTADRLHVVQRSAEADRLHDRRRAGLEAMRRAVVGDTVFGDDLDHLAATVEGRQLLQQRLLA